MIIDSNLIIYAVKPEYESLAAYIEEHSPSVSAISQVEVLGYHKLDPDTKQMFEVFFSKTRILPVKSDVILRAISLRQMRKMSLGDALIAATALLHSFPLLTHNTSDFNWIPGLIVIDPLDPAAAP